MAIVLLSTSQFVAGIIGIFLDNTIPGTKKERGLLAWNSTERFSDSDFDVYDIPWLRCITDLPFMKFCPISPAWGPTGGTTNQGKSETNKEVEESSN